ncbi:MAG: hypothetical protein NVV83_09910 [Afipia sp.]|nr:hypothetical protein [Afipia sp.]
MGDLISKMLATYGQTSAAYKVSAVKMHYDVSGTPLPHNPEFVFERRTGMPYGSQVYFSSSALRTEDHLKILSVMEDLFRGK